MQNNSALPPGLLARAGRALGRPVEAVERLRTGYSQALRLRARLRGGETVFLKCAVDADSARWLTREQAVYAALQASFMPRMLGWSAEGGLPILALEDLSGADWPPPWSMRQVGLVIALLDRLGRFDLPWLETVDIDNYRGWQAVARDPAPFLSLGLASPGWLERALPALLSIDPARVVAGDALVHRDVRSDNLCFAGDRVLLVDWNLACRGSPTFDLASWLPSLENEGGPPPDAILPGRGDWAAVFSGYFAARAGLPVLPHAPRVRVVQLAQLRAALPWAIRALGLPPLDG